MNLEKLTVQERMRILLEVMTLSTGEEMGSRAQRESLAIVGSRVSSIPVKEQETGSKAKLRRCGYGKL